MSVFKFTNMSKYAISTALFESISVPPKASLSVELPSTSKPQTIIDLRAKQGEYVDMTNFIETMRFVSSVLLRDYGESFLSRVKIKIELPAPPPSLDLIKFNPLMKVGETQVVEIEAKNVLGKILLGTKSKGIIKISGMEVTAEKAGKAELVYGTKEFNRSTLIEVRN